VKFDGINLLLGDRLGLGPDRKIEGTPYRQEGLPPRRVSDHLMQFNPMEGKGGRVLNSPPISSVEIHQKSVLPNGPRNQVYFACAPASDVRYIVEELAHTEPGLEFKVSIEESFSKGILEDPFHRVTYEAKTTMDCNTETKITCPEPAYEPQDFTQKTFEQGSYEITIGQKFARPSGVMADGTRAFRSVMGLAPEVEARYSMEIDSAEKVGETAAKTGGAWDFYLFEAGDCRDYSNLRSEVVGKGISGEDAGRLWEERGLPDEGSVHAEFAADENNRIQVYGFRGGIEGKDILTNGLYASLVPRTIDRGIDPELVDYLETGSHATKNTGSQRAPLDRSLKTAEEQN
jgi:hypothetical protein